MDDLNEQLFLVGGNRVWNEFLYIDPIQNMIACTICKTNDINQNYWPVILGVNHNVMDSVNKVLIEANKFEKKLNIRAMLTKKSIFLITQYEFPENVKSVVYRRFGDLEIVQPRNIGFEKKVENPAESLFMAKYMSRFLYLNTSEHLFMILVLNKFFKRLIMPNFIQPKTLDFADKYTDQLAMIQVFWPEINLTIQETENQQKVISVDPEYTFGEQLGVQYVQLEKRTGFKEITVQSYI